MYGMEKTETPNVVAPPKRVGVTMADGPVAEVGLGPKRAAFERFARACPMGQYSVDRDTRPGGQDGYWSSHTQVMWDAWCAAWDCQQASIDRLMLEWCPDEMAPEQMAGWADSQVASERERCAAICEGVRNVAEQAAHQKITKTVAMASAALCAKLIRV